MKRLKLLSILLAILMILPLLPAGILPTFAEDATTIGSITVDGTTYERYTCFTNDGGTTGFNIWYGSDKATNGKSNSSVESFVWYNNPTTGAYVEFHSSFGFVPYGYILTTGRGVSGYTCYNPTIWTVKAKLNEADEWTVLTSVGSETLENVDYKAYTFPISYDGVSAPDQKNYQYFRVEFNAHSTQYLKIDEIEFYGLRKVHLDSRAASCVKIGYARDFWLSDGKYYADEDLTSELSASSIEIPKTAHTLTHHDAVPATSTTNGNIEYWSCSTCKQNFADANAETAVDDVVLYGYFDYLAADGSAAQTTGGYTYVNDSDTAWSDGWYVVSGKLNPSVRYSVSGTVNLLLLDHSELQCKGISVPEGATLNVFAQSTGGSMGWLTTRNVENYYAGIGGNRAKSGTINIHGGDLLIEGGYDAAGIGGGYYAAGGTITITGGNVDATGGTDAAGIGGGRNGAGGTITITGGNVKGNATFNNTAGIGGGSNGNSGIITISGGVVFASAFYHSAAIGAGGYDNKEGGSLDTITITGGQITTQTNASDEIGIGACDAKRYNSEGTVNISLSSPDDFIDTKNIVAGTVNLDTTHTYRIEGQSVPADAEAIRGGGKIFLDTSDTCTVSFYDGTDLYETLTAFTGSITAQPDAAPRKTGYRFVSWNTESGVPFDFENNVVTADLSLYANYEEADAITYVDENGNEQTTKAYASVLPQSTPLTLNTGVYVFPENFTTDSRITLNGSVTLILKKNVTITAINSVNLSDGASLIIYAEKADDESDIGKLIAQVGERDYPAIGWRTNTDDDAVIAIHGGVIDARGTKDGYGAAIGGGYQSGHGAIVITGGIVTANAKYNEYSNAAGIGGGFQGTVTSITISGGTVNAIGSSWAAGIGSSGSNSSHRHDLTITISGGTVTASSTSYGPGIGGTSSYQKAIINITGGTVTASNSSHGAGIGGGENSNNNISINISGGVVNATGNSYGAGIGSSSNSSNAFTITITGGQVIATGTSNTAGIGAKTNSSAPKISLGLTNADDFIQASSYSGTVTFLNPLKLSDEEEFTIATPENIGGHVLVCAGVPNATVTFVDEDGSTVVSVASVIPGNKAEAAAAPDKTSSFKTFSGWLLNGEAFDFNTAITTSITLTASYTAVPAPSGSGSSTDPYIIASTEDWNKLADLVNTYKYTLAGLNIKLTEDIEVSTMIGTENTRFAGIFNGDGHTLTFNVTSNNQYAAPFRYASDATFENLKVQGTIRTSDKYGAGFVGDASSCTFTNCVSSITIDSSVNGDGTHGGFVATTSGSGTTYFTGCLFNGELLGSATNSSSGFVGWTNNSLVYTDCICDPSSVTMDTTSSNKCVTFNRSGKNTFVNSGYVSPIGEAQGKQLRTIAAGENVTVALAGTLKTYGLSGIMAGDTGILYKNTVYGLSGDSVALTLGYTGTLPEGASAIYHASEGTLSKNSNGYTLTMPDQDVTITATSDVVYDVIFNAGDGGELALIGNNFKEGDDVKLTVTPDAGFVLDTITFKIGTEDIETVKFNKNTYSFKMPADNVTVTATFKAVTLTGSGTSADPYVIATSDDWAAFADKVNGGETSACAKLTADISVDCMVGTSTNKYAGVFDGYGHTITVTLVSDGEKTAPFRYVSGATIQFLTVAGCISTSAKYAAGIVSDSAGCTLIGCRSSVTIDSTVKDDGTHGGLVATTTGKVTFTNCLFDGILLGMDTDRCAGFLGYNVSSIVYNNCFFNPTELSMKNNDNCCFNRNGNNTINNSYYAASFGALQGTSASGKTAAEMVALLGSGWTIENGAAVPATDRLDLTHATITNIVERYKYTGEAINYVVPTIVALDGTVLILNTDFTFTLSSATVKELGSYTATITGTGAYTGSFELTFVVQIYDANMIYDENLLGDGLGGWYVLIPKTGTVTVDLSNAPSGFVFYVYDDGGKNGKYNNSSNGYLLLNGPDGSVFKLEGTCNSEKNCDKFSVFDGDTAIKLIDAVSGSVSLNPFYTSGKTAKLYFSTDSSSVNDGIDLKMTICGEETSYDIVKTADVNGTIDGADSAKKGDPVTLTMVPNDNCMFVSVSIIDSLNREVEATVYGNTVSFTMPSGKVTVIAEFKTISFIRDLANGTVEYVKCYDYSNTEIVPTFVVKNYIGETLTEGTDYTVSRSGIVKAVGVYTATIFGKGVYTGSVSVKLGVSPDSDLSFDGENFYVDLKKSVTIEIDLANAPAGFTFIVYDDGGVNGEYTNSFTGDAKIVSALGTALTFSGSGTLESGWDFLYLYDSDYNTSLGGNTNKNNIDCFSYTINFSDLTTTSNGGLVHFTSDSSNVKEGFAVTVTVVSAAIPGDVNGDGLVNISDVTALLDILAGNDYSSYLSVGDVDGSGTLDISDVTVLLNLLATAV